MKGAKQVARPVEALSPRELGRLFAAAEGSRRDTAILNLLARAGLRVGEVVRLHLSDVETTGRYLHPSAKRMQEAVEGM